MFSRWFKKPRTQAAEALYREAVAQARRPEFYETLGAPDTVDGRFDLLVLHVHLLLRRLRAEGEDASQTAQDLFDVMFRDMDASLREMGVGDLVVGKRIQRMASAFYGRAARYEEAFDPKAEPNALEAALLANVLPHGTAETASRLADYVRRQSAALRSQPATRIARGVVRFDAPVLEEAPA